MDKVEQLQPDLVLASLSVPGMERNIEELEKRKIPYVIVPNPKTLTEVGESLLFVGEATNTSDRAKELVKKFNRILEKYQSFQQASSKAKNPLLGMVGEAYFYTWSGKLVNRNKSSCRGKKHI